MCLLFDICLIQIYRNVIIQIYLNILTVAGSNGLIEASLDRLKELTVAGSDGLIEASFDRVKYIDRCWKQRPDRSWLRSSKYID